MWNVVMSAYKELSTSSSDGIIYCFCLHIFPGGSRGEAGAGGGAAEGPLLDPRLGSMK